MQTHDLPDWFQEGVALAGMYEGLLFPQRRGESGRPHCVRPDAEEAFEQSFCEEFAEQLLRDGINLIILNFHKGLGWEAESAERARMQRLQGYCRARGIRVGGYIGDTVFREFLPLEQPEALDWVCRRADGEPVYYNARQNFRLKCCCNNPGWRQYLEAVALRAARDFQLDWVHFDNVLLSPPPEDCHCQYCRQAFLNFLSKKFPGEALRHRFGFSSLEYVEPPQTADDYSLEDPLVQEWLRFRAESLTEFFHGLSRVVRAASPGCVVELNCLGNAGEPSLLKRGVKHSAILRSADAFWDEAAPFPRRRGEQIISRARTYKLARARGVRPILYTTYSALHQQLENSSSELLLGEAMTFGEAFLGSVNFVYFADQWEIPAAVKSYICFFRRYPQLFRSGRVVSCAAVYRGDDSALLDYARSEAQVCAAEQVLLQGHLSYNLLLDGDLPEADPETVLVLAGQTCLSEKTAAEILLFLQRGGRMLILGDCGIYDDWRRPLQPSRGEEWLRDWSRQVTALPLAAAPLPGGYDGLDAVRWPVNGEEIVAELCSLYGRELPLSLSAPRSLLCECVQQDAELRVHCLNYCPAEKVDIALELPACSPEQMVLYMPGQEPRVLTSLSFSLEGTYCCLQISCRRTASDINASQ